MIDPRLQTLRVLHEEGTVTAAAVALSLTPSTVSQQLRQLARDVGVRLLEPTGRRVRLTPAAMILLDHANVLHAQSERARAELAAHREGSAGVLRMTAMPTALVALVAPAAARLREDHPQVTVEMSEDETHRCFDLLITGQSDIGFVVPTPDSPPPDDMRFEQMPLLDEPQDLLVPADHRLAARPSVALADAAHEAWISSPERVAHHQLQLAACAAAGFTPHITHRGMDWVGISAMVAHGFGISLLPRLAYIPSDHTVVRLPLHGDPIPTRRHIACIRRGSGRHPLIAAGLQAVRAVCLERTDVTVIEA